MDGGQGWVGIGVIEFQGVDRHGDARVGGVPGVGG